MNVWSSGQLFLQKQLQPQQMSVDQKALVSVTWHRMSDCMCQRSVQVGSQDMLGC